MAQEHIYQVSEETEGRVTKKLSEEFSRTESRILGALSELDEFLLNPQIRTCSAAVPGTSMNINSENREPTGDRSLDDPCPEVRFSSDQSGNLYSPEVEEYPHRPYLWVQEKLVQFRQSTQNAGLCPVESMGQLHSDSAFNLFRNLCDKFLVDSRNGHVSRLAVPRMFLLYFFWNGCHFCCSLSCQSLFLQCCHPWRGKNARGKWRLNYLLFFLSLRIRWNVTFFRWQTSFRLLPVNWLTKKGTKIPQ